MQVSLIQLTRKRYALPDDELEEIRKLIKLSDDVERGDVFLNELADDVEPIILIEGPPAKKPRLVKTASQKLRDKENRLARKQEKSETGGEKRKRATKSKEDRLAKKQEKSETGGGKRKKAAKPKGEPKKRKISKRKLELELHPRPDIKVMEKDPLFETRTPMPYISKVANSRLIFRAINLQDNKLLTKLLNDGNNIYMLHTKSVDCDDQPLLEAFRFKNKDVILTMLHECYGDKFKSRLKNNAEEKSMLEKLNTGSYNERSLGVQFIRKIAASRGCRDGNNAFLKKDKQVERSSGLKQVYKSPVIIDTDQSDAFKQFWAEKNLDCEMRTELRNDIPELLLLGKNVEAGKIIQSLMTGAGKMFNSVFQDVLLFTNEELKNCPPHLVKHTVNRHKKLSPFHCAAANPNSKYLEKLLSVMPEVHTSDALGRAPIHFAAGCSSTSTLRLLLNWGANPSQADSSGKIPLIYAIEANRPENVLLLLEEAKKKGAEDTLADKFGTGGVNRRIKNSSTPLHIAAEKKFYEISKILLEFGAQVNAKLSVSSNQVTPLMNAAASGDLKMVRLLVDHAAEVEQKDRMGCTAVIHACMNGATSVLSYFLNIGASAERADSSGNTPLHYAAAYGWFFTVRLLLEAGADSNVGNMWKTTPVAVAYFKGHIGIVRELLNNGKANINFPDDHGMTMIFHACTQDLRQSDLCEQIKYMVEEKGALCSLKDNKGQTLLHHLADVFVGAAGTDNEKIKAYEQSVAIAELLLKNGCELNALNERGYTAVMIVLEKVVNFPLAEFLLKEGCEIHLPPDGNPTTTLLHSMAENVWMEPNNLCRFFDLFKDQQKHMDTFKSMANYVDSNGFTPLLLAILKALGSSYQPENLVAPEKFVRCLIQDLQSDVNAKVEKKFFSKESRPAQDDAKGWWHDYSKAEKSAVHLALNSAHSGILKDLINSGADLNVHDLSGLTPLALCIKSNYLTHLDLLFETSRCDFNLPIQVDVDNKVYKVNPILYACTSGKDANMIVKLIDCGCDIFASVWPNTLMGCLHDLISSRSNNAREDILKVVQKFAEKKYDFNQMDSHKRTALHYAVKGNTGSLDESHELEVKLVQLGANVGLTDDSGKTALHYVFDKGECALMSDPAELTKLICRSMTKDQVNIRDSSGQTALHYAAQNGAVTCCMYLTMIGADVNIQDNDGNTPLALAVKFSKDGCATTLILSGTNLKHMVAKWSEKKEANDNSITSNEKGVGKTNTQGLTPDPLYVPDEPEEDWKWQVTTLLQETDEVRCVPLYQAAIENNLNGAAMFVTDAGFSKSGLTEYDALRIAIKTCKYNVALRLLCTTTDLKLLCQLGDNNQNLLHTLGLSCEHNTNRHNETLNKIAEVLMTAGLSPDATDSWDCTPIMYALINRHYALANVMANKIGAYELAYEDGFKRTYFAAALWRCHSDNICTDTMSFIHYLSKYEADMNCAIYLPLNPELANVKLQKKKLDPDIWQGYFDDKTTALIIAITCGEFGDSSKFLRYGSNPNTPDGKGITPLMHAIMQNKVKNVRQLLHYTYDPVRDAQTMTHGIAPRQTWNTSGGIPTFQLKDSSNISNSDGIEENRDVSHKIRDEQNKEEEEQEFAPVTKTSTVDLNAKDSKGRTALHYVARPLEMGTFDNAEIAFVLVKAGAKMTKDSTGLTPYDLALESGAFKVAQVLKKHFKLTNRNEKTHFKQQDPPVDDGLSKKLMDLPDYKSIADKFLEQFNSDMEIEDSYIHEVDELCNVVDGGLVMDEEQNIPYDALLTKVDVTRGEWGLYNFYHMQLVHQPSKNLYVLFTRWGRIEDEGQYQHTPYTDKNEAVTQFTKLFREKSGNNWTDVQIFERKPGKHRLVEDIARKAPPPQKAVKFDLETKCHSLLPEHLYNVINTLMNPKAIQLSMGKTPGYDLNSLPFGQLNKERLNLGMQLLEQIEKLVDENEKYTSVTLVSPRDQAEINAFQNNLEKIAELSNEYYHVIPQPNYVYEEIRPLDQRTCLNIQIRNLSNLLNYEVACKMLLAAMYEKERFNPVAYVYRCLDCKMERMKENDTMSQMILKYIWGGSEYQVFKIHGIYKLARKGEAERFLATGIENRRLLWHGSSPTNMLSILSRGLLVSPPEAKFTGSAYGKGIYFSDYFAFSNNYIDSAKTKFMLLCEVALGKMQHHSEVYGVKEKQNGVYNSVVVTRYQHDDPISCFTLPSGVIIPDAQSLKNDRRSGNMCPQYVISDPAQVCLRYLVCYS